MKIGLNLKKYQNGMTNSGTEIITKEPNKKVKLKNLEA
jgi:hypothetical protein